jgi:uncharacterized protein (DUF433 family)
MSLVQNNNPADANPERAQLFADQLRQAMIQLHETIEVDPQMRTGKPVIRGTRLTVAQILAELAEGATLSEIAEDFDVDLEPLRKALEAMALYLDEPFPR